MNNGKSVPGISRIDSKHTHGWYVRVYGNGGVFTSKLFSDRLYGGKDAALDNAKEYRDRYSKIAKEFKREGRNPNRRPFYSKAPKNNQSGVVGVNEVKTHIRGKEVHYFKQPGVKVGKQTPASSTFQKNEVEKTQRNWQLN